MINTARDLPNKQIWQKKRAEKGLTNSGYINITQAASEFTFPWDSFSRCLLLW
jgi:hypothetical protein